LVRSERVPQIGDKICSRSAQKNSIGLTLPPEDMPITAHGVTPDIIINPNAFPSRMTMNHMIETLLGKVSALEGCIADGTPFQNIDLKDIEDRLASYGYQRDGHEVMYHGMTGKKIEADIFIGPTYYQRLRHIVADKIHSRSNRGPRQMLTRLILFFKSRLSMC
jgi:DNA-directed RNA polymerase II subunit RPB2